MFNFFLFVFALESHWLLIFALPAPLNLQNYKLLLHIRSLMKWIFSFCSSFKWVIRTFSNAILVLATHTRKFLCIFSEKKIGKFILLMKYCRFGLLLRKFKWKSTENSWHSRKTTFDSLSIDTQTFCVTISVVSRRN